MTNTPKSQGKNLLSFLLEVFWRRLIGNFAKHFRQYANVTSVEQWTEYEAEFNQLHSEYEKLHNYVESIIRVFSNYKEEIQKFDPGSNDYNVTYWFCKWFKLYISLQVNFFGDF